MKMGWFFLRTYLSPPTALNDGDLPAVLVDGLDVVAEAGDEAGEGEEPEDEAEGLGEPLLERGRLVAQVEGDGDGDCDYGHVDA